MPPATGLFTPLATHTHRLPEPQEACSAGDHACNQGAMFLRRMPLCVVQPGPGWQCLRLLPSGGLHEAAECHEGTGEAAEPNESAGSSGQLPGLARTTSQAW